MAPLSLSLSSKECITALGVDPARFERGVLDASLGVTVGVDTTGVAGPPLLLDRCLSWSFLLFSFNAAVLASADRRDIANMPKVTIAKWIVEVNVQD